MECRQNLKSKNSFILIFQLKVTEHEQRKSQSEFNLRAATNEIGSLRTIIKEYEESLEGFYVSLFKNINKTLSYFIIEKFLEFSQNLKSHNSFIKYSSLK